MSAFGDKADIQPVLGPQLETATLPQYSKWNSRRQAHAIAGRFGLPLHIVFVGLLIVSTEK